LDRFIGYLEENSMTKAEIIDAVYEKVGGFSKKEAAEIVEAVFDSMKDVLTQGEKIKISGFGNFVVRYKKQRIGRNPQTGEPIPISARRVLTFKPSQVLKGILNPHKTGAEFGAPLDSEETPAMPVPSTSPGGYGDGGGTPSSQG
jgi:integration host factor subunit alpha